MVCLHHIKAHKNLKDKIMNVTGIIAEYNPFHNGHLYQIQKARENKDDYIVVVMSGDFMQRGTPAIIDKYARANMALLCGADLVLELPALYATGSAWYFARGAVSMLDKLGCVNSLCFGCETDDTSYIMQAADILINETSDFKSELQKNLKNGIAFPKAREIALNKISSVTFPSDLSCPNNILALEYCLAIKERNSMIIPNPIKREGTSYHEEMVSSAVNPSATAVRKLLNKNSFDESIADFVPPKVYEILKEHYHKTYPIEMNDFSSLLNYKLLLEGSKGFTDFYDIPESLSDKIIKNCNHFRSYDDFCSLLKSKDITYSRINRGLTHILLHIMEETAAYYKNMDYTCYARILGLKKEASSLLSVIKKNASIPLISKLADAPHILPDYAMPLLNLDILSSHIYQSVVSELYHVPFQNENTRQIISF